MSIAKISKSIRAQTNNYRIASYIHRTVDQGGFVWNSVACYRVVNRKGIFALTCSSHTSFNVSETYFLALSPPVSEITDGNPDVGSGRKEMVDRTEKLLLRWHSGLDTLQKDTAQNLACHATLAMSGPFSQLLNRLCMLSQAKTALVQHHIRDLRGRVSAVVREDLGSADRYVWVRFWRKLECLDLCPTAFLQIRLSMDSG